MTKSITIKELHATTGELVRRAGASRFPVIVTDRGEAVALLGNLSLLKPIRRKRTILPGYAAMMDRGPSHDVLDDLDAAQHDDRRSRCNDVHHASDQHFSPGLRLHSPRDGDPS
jgi:antitoxin (DNA-binding transcriptional repressor) of toxin-antitoxin stability system